MKNATTNMTVEQAQSTIEFCEYAFRNMDLSDAAFDKCLAEYGAAKAVIDNAAKIAETEETTEATEQVAEVSTVETDGSEEDADTNEVFSLLPALVEVDEDDDTDEPEILNADKWVNLYFSPAHEKNGSTYVKIGGNKLSFSGHELYSITDERHGFELKFSNGRKIFYKTGFHTGIMNSYRHVICAKKVVETYMSRELAAEQEKNFRNFFLTDARKNSTGFYTVLTMAIFADEIQHNYGVSFDKFSEAQAFVAEVKEFIGDIPAFIVIRSHHSMYYHRQADGSEEYTVDTDLLEILDEYTVSKAAFDAATTGEEAIAQATMEETEMELINPAPELTGKMKWAAELLDNYTYEFEGDWEAGNGGLARHYKRFNRYGEECGKLVEVFTDKTGFILDHVNIVDKSIRTYYYINGEKLCYLNLEFNFIWSDKYKAGMNVVGGEHLQVEVPDGQWKKYKNFMVNNDEFFQIMSERGACTIGEENRKLDEAFTEPESPATFKVGKTYLAERRRAGDELATFKILGRSIMFVTAMPVAFAECDAFDEDKDYVFKVKIQSDKRGEYFNYDDMTVSAGEAYQLDESEPVEPPVESFTAKRDRLLAERDAANAKLKEAEEAFKAAKLAKYNADDKLYTFMVSAVEELNEKLLPLPDAEIEVKTMEGYLAFIYPETVYADCDDLKFTLRGDCSELNGLTLGTYDTPEQVMAAVEELKAAIERGDERFDFNQKPDAQNFNQALVA